MREMGKASKTRIEPGRQTKLLDECLGVPGVLAGGVPGGIFFLIVTPQFYHILTLPYF